MAARRCHLQAHDACRSRRRIQSLQRNQTCDRRSPDRASDGRRYVSRKQRRAVRPHGVCHSRPECQSSRPRHRHRALSVFSKSTLSGGSMSATGNWKSAAAIGALSWAFATAAFAAGVDIPAGSLESALDAYSAQTGVQLLYAQSVIRGTHSKGVKGDLSPDEALSRLLSGTGFSIRRDSGVVAIVRDHSSAIDSTQAVPQSFQIAQAAPAPRTAVETVTVTSSKLGGADVQSIPISITALSQEQLTATQTTGGPDLVKQVPNLTFSKTNFTGYNIQIRGIGTQ